MRLPKHLSANLLLVTALVTFALGCSRAPISETGKTGDQVAGNIGSQAEIDLIQDDIHERFTALFAGDYETHLDSAHPVLFALGGGRATVQQKLEAEYQEFAGMKLKDITFPSEPTFLRGTRNEFAIAPVTLVIDLGGALIESTAFHLGVRAIRSSEWKYLDGVRLDKASLIKLFPDFPTEHELPPNVTKRLEL